MTAANMSIEIVQVGSAGHLRRYKVVDENGKYVSGGLFRTEAAARAFIRNHTYSHDIGLFSHEATDLPATVTNAMPEIVEAASQACFGEIAKQLEALGYSVTGDFSPDEIQIIDAVMQNFIRTMALNNNEIAALNDF